MSCIFWGGVDSYTLKNEPELRSTNEIRGNDFTGSTLKDTDFRGGVDLTVQKLPQGPDYAFALDGDQAIERMWKVAATWGPEHKDTRKVLSYASIFRDNYDDGQRQLFTCRIGLADPLHWDQVRDVINQTPDA